MKHKRLSLSMKKEIAEKLHFISEVTGLKYIKIISNGIEKEYIRLTELEKNVNNK